MRDLVSSSGQKGNHHHPSEEERAAQDQWLYVYHYNQGDEKVRRDNRSRPYPSLMLIRNRFETSKYRHNSFQELGLGGFGDGWEGAVEEACGDS